MKRFPYYRDYPDDFFDATVGWSGELKGAYAVLLKLIYWRDGNLPDDSGFVAGHLGLTVRKWNALKRELIERGKIAVVSGMIRNSRADKELIIRKTYRENRAENARRPHKKQGADEAHAAAHAPQNARDSTRVSDTLSEETIVSSGAGAPSGGVSEPDRPPSATPGDVWRMGAELLSPADPQKGRKALGLINSSEIIAVIGSGEAASTILRQTVLAALQADPADAVEYMRKTARRLVREATQAGVQTGPGAGVQPEATMRDGRLWIRDPVTGAEKPLANGRAAA